MYSSRQLDRTTNVLSITHAAHTPKHASNGYCIIELTLSVAVTPWDTNAGVELNSIMSVTAHFDGSL